MKINRVIITSLKVMIAIVALLYAAKCIYVDLYLIPQDYLVCEKYMFDDFTNRFDKLEHPINWSWNDHFTFVSINFRWLIVFLGALFVSSPLLIALVTSKNTSWLFAAIGIVTFICLRGYFLPDFRSGFHDCDYKGSNSGLSVILTGAFYFFSFLIISTFFIFKKVFSSNTYGD